jgi:hypothetical protein
LLLAHDARSEQHKEQEKPRARGTRCDLHRVSHHCVANGV